MFYFFFCLIQLLHPPDFFVPATENWPFKNKTLQCKAEGVQMKAVTLMYRTHISPSHRDTKILGQSFT